MRNMSSKSSIGSIGINKCVIATDRGSKCFN